MQSQETLINPGFGVSSSFQGCHQKTEKEAYFQMDSFEIPRLFQWKCNLRVKCFYSVGLILHNCCNLVFMWCFNCVGLQRGCEERCADDQFQCHNNLCISLKWLCDGQEDCKMGEDERNCQGTGEKTKNDGKKINPVKLLNTYGSNKFEALPACVWNMTYWGKSSVLSRGDWASRPAGVWAPGQHGLSFTHEVALRSSFFLTCSTSQAADLTPAAFPVLPTCSVNEYVCASGGCVSASLRCDGHDNCLDGSDEVSAPPLLASRPPPAPFINTLFFPTRSRHLSTQTSENVPAALRCTAKGSDTCCFLSPQIGCVKECREDEFLCLNRAHCIPRRWRCDDVFDCMDHSDEENCSQGKRGRTRARAQTTGWRWDADGLINDITAPRRTSDDFISGLC